MLDQLFTEKRTFSRFEAAYDISKDCQENGIISRSMAKLAAAWGWPKAKVQRFISELLDASFLVKQDRGKYALANQKKKLERIEVLEFQKIESKEPELIPAGQYEVPMFNYEVPKVEGVPPTAEQLKGPQLLIDLSKVDHSQAMEVPMLRFYLKYLDQNNRYVQRESDKPALDQIIRNIKKMVSMELKGRKNSNDRFKRKVLEAIDGFIENLQQTYYAGWDLNAIAQKWNQVVAACVKIKKGQKGK